jgi:predicted nucleotidyltransferase
MDRQTALSNLRALAPELRRRGIDALYLFGSSARNETRADSDADLFFDYSSSAHLSLLDVIGIQHFLEDAWRPASTS